MNILDHLKQNILLLDGGMGTLLQKAGLQPGGQPETWNLTHPDVITQMQQAYFEAGSNVVAANTFGANTLKFAKEDLFAVIEAAFANARKAAQRSVSAQPKWVALDIGPTGKLLKPYGDLAFEDAVEIFSKTVRCGVRAGADLILIETMNDSLETKAAVLAAKENSDLPVFVSNAYGSDGKLLTGASPAAMVAMLEGLGADAVGVNCSLGPKALADVVSQYLQYASVPVLFKPNAGLPREVDGETSYDVPPTEFADDVSLQVKKGVRIAGGCCGTTPAYIRALAERLQGAAPAPITEKNRTVVSSYTHAVEIGGAPVLIGERINPTGKKRLKQALKENDLGYLLDEGLRQQNLGADILDVNVGLPEIDEPDMLTRTVLALQEVLDLPLQIDTSDPVAMAAALRCYNGKAMVNSVNGKDESMRAVFPLVKKYGGVVVALTLDENGIPGSADGRVAIAKRIVSTAAAYGIAKKDLVFDPLCMAVSAAPEAARVTLEALSRIRQELECKTVLGVSNVSYGLPRREVLNAAFFTLALGGGLSAAIMNPDSAEMMKSFYSFCALNGQDENFEDYIAYAERLSEPTAAAASLSGKTAAEVTLTLSAAIVKGRKKDAAVIAKALLNSLPPLQIVTDEIIPALDRVGVAYEKQKVYLPQLLMSAEAAKCAFEAIKEKASQTPQAVRGCVVIATVRGDIHDIGKNIVKLLLENYGFRVFDLGKDVAPEAVAAAVEKYHAPLCGLSALMTTTVPAMRETVALLKERAPFCRTVVGGAVLNEEYARKIGADHYSPDAMDTVRYAVKCLDGDPAEGGT